MNITIPNMHSCNISEQMRNNFQLVTSGIHVLCGNGGHPTSSEVLTAPLFGYFEVKNQWTQSKYWIVIFIWLFSQIHYSDVSDDRKLSVNGILLACYGFLEYFELMSC